MVLLPKPEFREKHRLSPQSPRVRAAEARAAAAKAAEDSAQRFTAATAPIRETLKKVGLEDAPRVARSRARIGEPANEGHFETLDYVQALAIQLERQADADRVLNIAEREFDVLLDYKTENDVIGAKVGRKLTRRPKTLWPDWTGIEAARDVHANGVLMGVLDTGVDADHSAFRSRCIEFRYFPHSGVQDPAGVRNVRGFDTDGHGTHVCGILAAKRTGIAPAVNLHVASVIESETLRASIWRTFFALDWVYRWFTDRRYRNVPCVINLSLCFFEDRMEQDEVDAWKLMLHRPLQDLERKGALIVAAAGNRGAGHIGFPAKFDFVLSVGAVDKEQRVADFSGLPTRDAPRDIYGFGVDVVSALERDRDGRSQYLSMSGTSMAAPYVSGLAAMLFATKPSATAREVREHLLNTALKASDGVPIARFQHWP